MLAKLTQEGVPAKQANTVVHTVADRLGMIVTGSVHCRTTGRCNLEAGIAAELQFVEAVKDSKSKFRAFLFIHIIL